MKTARYAGTGFRRLPSFLPAAIRLCWIGVVHDRQAFPRDSVAFRRKDEIIWVALRKETCPKTQDHNSAVVQRKEPPRPGFGLAMAHGNRTGIEINLAPPHQS